VDSLYDKYFVCEDGHITSSNTKINSCPARWMEMQYVKGKRKNDWKAIERGEQICGKKIEREGVIPKKLEFTKVWDYEVMYAFLQDQRIDSSFMLDIQTQLSKIWERLDDKK
jgi:hypothetical protein